MPGAKLPSSLSIAVRVVDKSKKSISGMIIRFWCLSNDGYTLSVLNDERTKPYEATTGADGVCTISFSAADAIKKLLTPGNALLFKNAALDAADTPEAGLSRSTPLYLAARQQVSVVLSWEPKRDSAAGLPPVPAQLLVAQVTRDERVMPTSVTLRGKVLSPQDQPLANLTVTASVRLPSTGKVLPLPISTFSAPVSDKDGSFQVELTRVAELAPFQPYSMFPISLSVSLAGEAGAVKSAELDAASWFHVKQSADTAVSLRFDPASAPTALKLLTIQRAGRNVAPSEEILEIPVCLLEKKKRRPLVGYTVIAKAGGDARTMVRTITQSGGFFALRHPIPLAQDGRDVDLTWQLQVVNPLGNTVASGVALKRDAGADDPVEVVIDEAKPSVASPTIAQTLTALSLTLTTKSSGVLTREFISTLRDIQERGGLRSLKDFDPADDPALEKLEQAADLFGVLPPSVATDKALAAIKELLAKGIRSSAALGALPRFEVTKLLQSQLGDFKASQAQHVAAARANLLNSLLLGARVERSYAKAPIVSSADGDTVSALIMPLDAEPGCACEQCQTAVSPNAYLADLIRYVYVRVRTGVSATPVEATNLQSLFHQPFADLPASCESMDQPLLVARIAIEAMRSFATTQPALSTPAQATLDEAEVKYRQDAYEALLRELGTTTSELRLAQGDDAALTAIADRLGLRNKDDAEDLLLSSTELEDEVLLESRFGLRDSSRAPLDAAPTPAVLTWRLARMASGWQSRDRLITFPANTPILDPDVLDVSNLRHMWNSAHATTSRWNTRRDAIKAQKNTRINGRAQTIGEGVVAVSQPALGHTATTNEAWAAYVSVTITDAEIESMAAILPAAQQDAARSEAIQKKALAFKKVRDNDPAATLSTAEHDSINAILAYVGTGVQQAAQAKAEDWVDARIIELTPTAGGSGLSLSAWAVIHGVLKGTNTTRPLAAVKQDLSDFGLTVEGFIRLWDLKLQIEGQGYRSINESDWAEFDSILVARWKGTQLATWASDEQAANIKVTSDLFWKGPDQGPQPPWLGSTERYGQWLSALESAQKAPVIDPDLLTNGAFVSTDPADLAFARFSERQSWVTSTLSALGTAKTNVVAATPVNRVSVYDAQLLAPGLLVKETAAVTASPAWYEIPGLQAAYDQGSMPIERLDQILVTRTEFNVLMRVRSLLRAQKSVTDSEWADVVAILLQVQKRRKFGTWRAEEASDGIALSPTYFKLPPQPVLSFPPPPSPDAELPAWRANKADVNDWRATLSARIQQQDDAKQAQSDQVDRVEQRALAGLRDALITAYAPTEAGTTLTDRAEWLTDRLLIDMRDGAGSKTTRVAHALTTLQQLVTNLHSGHLFSRRQSGSTQYPDLELVADHFRSEWEWMGSYGSWRSALFIFMYPENLLHPTLRPAAEQSEPFRALTQSIRDAGSLTPEKARQIADTYQRYFDDLPTLEVAASCIAKVSMAPDGRYARAQDLIQKQYLFLFATSRSGLLYWCMHDLVAGTTSPWNPIKEWPSVTKLLGAVPFNTRSGQRYLVLAGIATDKSGTMKLQVMRLDLDKLGRGLLAWDTEPTSLDDLPENTKKYFYVDGFALEQVCLDDWSTENPHRPPYLYVHELGTSGYTRYYRRPLNGDATKWAAGSWDNFRIGGSTHEFTVVLELLSAFNIQAGSSDISYNFIARKYGELVLFSSHVTTSYAGESSAMALSSWAGSSPRFLGICHLGGERVLISTEIKQRVVSAGWSTTWEPEFLGDTYYLYDKLIPLSMETLYTFNPGLGTSVHIVTYYEDAITHATKYAIGSMPTPLSDSADWVQVDAGYYGIILRVSYPVSITEADATEDLTNRSFGSWLNYGPNNTYSPDAWLWRALEEACFAVPMHIGLQLQQAGFHQAALDWYRTIYDWTAPVDSRKIFFGLYLEQNTYLSYERTVSWLEDPMNPYAVAKTRPRAFSRFTLLTIIRCLLEYADADFAADTAESLPRARTLYLLALQLLQTEELTPGSSECEALIGSIDFNLVPSEWEEVESELLMALSEALPELQPDARSTLVGKVKAALKDMATPKWGKRFSNAFAAIKAARAAAPRPRTMSEVLKRDQQIRAQANLKALALPAWLQTGQGVNRHVGRTYRAAVSELTGVEPSNLDAQADIKLPWAATKRGPRKLAQLPWSSPPTVQGAETKRGAKRDKRAPNPLTPSRSAMSRMSAAAEPSEAVEGSALASVQYLVGSSLLFCIPPNPIHGELRLRAELNLYKLRTGRNIAGQERTLEPFAAPTDAQSGLPAPGGADGRIAAPGRSRLLPTPYRYSVLVERARRLVGLASQFESQLLQALEKVDNERRNLLDARSNLAVQRATLSLKDLEIQEAALGVTAVEKQQQRIMAVQSYLQGLIDEGLNTYEMISLATLAGATHVQQAAATLQLASAAAYLASDVNIFQTGAGAANALSAIAGSLTGLASALSTTSSLAKMTAEYERREQSWAQELKLADIDGQILDVQHDLSTTRVRVKEQEQRIVNLQLEHAESVVDFLVTKFTNKELYEWMSRVLQGLYAAQLQHATSMARLAQQQLAFDLLQDVSAIQADYWSVPLDGGSTTAASDDRRGLTGSARLQRDIERLDLLQVAAEQRRHQLSRTLSLATLMPGEFQRFRETGEIWFDTKEQDFDLEFPGHYFRRIRRVKLSALALIPPTHGIRATLSNVGTSRVVVPGLAGFETRTLPASYDSVALTSPRDTTGLFELDIQPELRLPFEGVGVDTQWHLELPRASNFLDFGSLADVLVTIEYTALSSPDYRVELFQNPSKLPTKIQSIRGFSFRREFADQWYELHNPGLAPTELRVRFDVTAADFPSGLRNIRVRRLSLYMPVTPDTRGNVVDLSQDEATREIGLAIGEGGVIAKQGLNSDHLIISQSDGEAWFIQLPDSLSPFGRYTLVLPAKQAVLDLLRADRIEDIVFAITYEADLPGWPTGQRPSRPLF